MVQHDELTQRQQREIAYHKEHAKLAAKKYNSLPYDVLYSGRRKWWNAYWDVFTYLRAQQLEGRKVLVVGCGAGEDAVRLAKLGASVYAFDLSSDMLAIASQLAASEEVAVDFKNMPAEKLDYPDDFFDVVFARDIFHHIDIPAAMTELRRVGKANAILIVDEIYSHSLTEIVRRSSLVEKVLYPRMQRGIYRGERPYITEDERKLSEHDVGMITAPIRIVRERFFNFIVTRLISDKYDLLNRLDRAALWVLGPLGRLCAGRIVIIGILSK